MFAAPTLNAVAAYGLDANSRIAVSPDGQAVYVTNPSQGQNLGFGLGDCPVSPDLPCKITAKQGIFGAYGTVT